MVDQHFAAENAHDVAATLAAYTDHIFWEDVTHPLGPVHGMVLRGYGKKPADQPWGERLARVSDPDGNMVLIASRAT